jgi:hypothetical protein
MTRPEIEGISPFFIISNVDHTIAFYRDKLGFETSYQEPQREPFFAIICRDGAHLFVKSGEAVPQPNPRAMAQSSGTPTSTCLIQMRWPLNSKVVARRSISRS